MIYKKLRDRLKNLEHKYPFIREIKDEDDLGIALSICNEIVENGVEHEELLFKLLFDAVEEYEKDTLPKDPEDYGKIIDMGLIFKCMRAVRDNLELPDELIFDLILGKHLNESGATDE